ncbi:YIP1 family protein [Bizionia argentinensis JUB59]|uniref:YIP1 family protein n=1 Tax=Bizionia argentinensis JUB59 TaxID=1046627 RepID=G2EFR0_9FLAO|nr:Yip1 family protein [Bizionia argentinensis]EGV42726.1 YIP1 family protein [Bizionia argentinensis JUB59]
MKKLKSFWKKPTETFELVLSKDINWIKTLSLFGCNGIIFIYYIMKSEGLINIESFKMTIVSILSMVSLGIIYGIFSNLIVGYLIKLTGKLFNAENDLKKIYSVLSWSYFPLFFSVLFLIPSIIVARIITTEIDTTLILILSLLIIVLMLVQAVFGIWQLILLFKGLKVAQKLNTLNAVLNYLSGAMIFGIFYYFLIRPYLY